MEPPDPLTLRAWDLSCLETPLAEAAARLIIVLTDAPGLADALADHLGVPVVRHHPPDARKVFNAHLADGSSDREACAAWLRALPPGQFDELLPEGLPPRYAARTADAALNLGVAGGASGAEVLRHVALAEGTEAVTRAQTDPVLRADLLAVTVYGGLHRGVVTQRAEDLLRLVESAEIRDTCAGRSCDHSAAGTRRCFGPETLRLLGARRMRRAGDGITYSVAFFRSAMRKAVWEVLCRDHMDFVPLLHSWLAGPGPEAEQVEMAGRAVAAMAVATGGRSMEHLRELALAPSRWAPQVAGWSLATAVQDPAAGRTAADLLEQWSVETEAPLRETVIHACHPDRGAVAEEHALRLLQQLLTTLDGDTDARAVATAVAETLKQRFEAGDSRAKKTVLRCMQDWSRGEEDVPGLLAALCFPAMVRMDLAWWSDQIRMDPQLISSVVRLAAHALNESSSFGSMHDALVDWCAEAARTGQQARALSQLLAELVVDRQPGFLRWLLAVERCPDSMPGRELATQAQIAWRAASPVSNTD
ncbi:hypothetical protein ACQPZG_16700 [Streptomyces sp. CA-294286]|uniref:hypothetical protein n=1 Tax=Streptomyces sp. CA-294286 TaxID=3240070 RepID=UPI003D8A2529